RISNRIEEVLEIVGLQDAAYRPFKAYSRGMRQKLGLARALLSNPSVLLLDEPTKDLDPPSAIEFRTFLRDVLSRDLKKTIVLVTHNRDEARSCCNRLAFMEDGRIPMEGTWRDIELYLRLRGFHDEVLST